MKNLVYALLGLTLIFSACKKNGTDSSTGKDSAKKKSEKELVLRFEKNPCFGTCPIYKAKLFSDGTLEYDGINFVKTKGQHEFKVNKTFITEVNDIIDLYQVVTLEDRYDNKHITDIPSTIIEVNRKGVNKNIYARADIPDDLKTFMQTIHKKLIAEIDEQSGASFIANPEEEKRLIPKLPKKNSYKESTVKKVTKG